MADQPSYEELEALVRELRSELERLREELRLRAKDRYEVPPHHR